MRARSANCVVELCHRRLNRRAPLAGTFAAGRDLSGTGVPLPRRWDDSFTFVEIKAKKNLPLGEVFSYYWRKG